MSDVTTPTAANDDKPPKHAGGRPSDYTIEIADEICARMAGGQSVREIASDPGMPCMRTIFYWLPKHPEFLQRYRAAAEARLHFHAEEILEIADDGRNDWVERHNRHGELAGYSVNGEAVSRSKLRIETREWLLGRLMPHTYGDRVNLNATISDPAADAARDSAFRAIIGRLDQFAAAQIAASQPAMIDVTPNKEKPVGVNGGKKNGKSETF